MHGFRLSCQGENGRAAQLRAAGTMLEAIHTMLNHDTEKRLGQTSVKFLKFNDFKKLFLSLSEESPLESSTAFQPMPPI